MVYTVNGKEHKSSWIAALSRWNAGKGVWCTPRKGTPEHTQVKAIQTSMMRNGPPPRPKSAQGMSGAGLLGRIDRPSTAPLPSPRAWEYRNVPMATVGGTGTAVPMATVVGTVVSQPPKAKKRAGLLPSVTSVKLPSVMSVAEVVDESDANGPWEDVGNTIQMVDEKNMTYDQHREGGRFTEARMMSALAKKVERKAWRKRQKKKYGVVREYGERAPIRKKSRPVTRKIKKLVRGK